MTLGNVMALRQDDVVRLLAWSTVAQAGWVVLPLVSISALGVGASATYLLTYVVATLVAFAVVAVVVRDRPGQGRSIADYEGLWQRSPWRAGALALALTSLAGLPPGVIGLVGKITALRPVVAEGWVWLAVVAAVNAVIGVAVYLRWLRAVITAPADGVRDHAGSRRWPGAGPTPAGHGRRARPRLGRARRRQRPARPAAAPAGLTTTPGPVGSGSSRARGQAVCGTAGAPTARSGAVSSAVFAWRRPSRPRTSRRAAPMKAPMPA